MIRIMVIGALLLTLITGCQTVAPKPFAADGNTKREVDDVVVFELDGTKSVHVGVSSVVTQLHTGKGYIVMTYMSGDSELIQLDDVFGVTVSYLPPQS